MPEEKQFLPEIIDVNKPGIKFEITNFSEIKKALTELLAQYKGFKLADNYGEAKDLRARLNNASKALNTKKIAVKKAYMEPYEYGENQIKELIGMIDNVSSEIDVQIKEYEEDLKRKKRKEIETVFAAFSNPRKIALAKVFSEKWLNAGTSLKMVESDINTFFEKVESDIVNIESLIVDKERQSLTVKLYVDCLDMGRAISEEKRIYEFTHKPKPIPVPPPTPVPVESPVKEPVPEEPVEEFLLTITGTKTQLLEVRDYLKDKGLKFKFERKE